MPVIHATEETFKEHVSKGVVLVDFWAEWCGPCRIISPIIEELASEYENKVSVVKVDIEQAREVVNTLGIMSIPTIQLYIDGQLKEEFIGFTTKEKLVDTLDSYL